MAGVKIRRRVLGPPQRAVVPVTPDCPNLLTNPSFEQPIAPDVSVPVGGWAQYQNDPAARIGTGTITRVGTWHSAGSFAGDLAATPDSSAAVLYGALAASLPTSDLYTIDPATGIATSVGPLGFAVTGLAYDATTDTLFGATSSQSTANPRSLITINRSTGAGTLVGSFGAVPCADITCDSTGQLWGFEGRSPQGLCTINKTTGAATHVGYVVPSSFGDALAANSTDVLYAMAEGGGGDLWTMDRTTGNFTVVATLTGAPFPGGSIGAAAFDSSDVLWAVNNGELLTINTTSGVVTTIGATTANMDALEWVGGGASSQFDVAAINPATWGGVSAAAPSGWWPVIPGDPITLTADSKGVAHSSTVRLAIDWHDTSHALLSTVSVGGFLDGVEVDGLTIKAIVPVGAAWAVPYVKVPTNAETLVDNVWFGPRVTLASPGSQVSLQGDTVLFGMSDFATSPSV